MITIICALAKNRAIGRDNQLIYHLSSDLRRFKALTTGHTIIMGRRTFESLPKGALPNRRNIVLTRQTGKNFPRAETFGSLEEALTSCKADEDVYIIGGESVYAAALPLADRLCLTEIDAEPEGADAFFPQFDPEAWEVTAREYHEAGERDAVPFSFVDYERA